MPYAISLSIDVYNQYMDHLQAIRIFTRVVETGGFSKAAHSLDVPLATVSKWVRSLEDHLGLKLLERTTRRVTVTNDGAAYYERIRQVVAEIDDIEATLMGGYANPTGTLRVDMGGSVARALVIPALSGFQTRYPNIQVYLSVTDRKVDLLSENVDCAIRDTGNDPNLVAQEIGAFDVCTCASPAYLARYGTPKHPGDIVTKKMPVAGYFSAHSGLVSPLSFRQGGEELALVDAHYGVMVSESNAHLTAAIHGLGVINTFEFMAQEAIASGQLVRVLTQWRPPSHPMYVVYPPSRRYSTKVKVFVEWIRTMLPVDG